MKKVNYTTVDELLENDGFLAWYRKTDKIERKKWNEWIEASKEHHRLASEAIRFLELIMRAKENSKITEHEINTTFDRIRNTIAIFEKRQVKGK
ncbi:MAG: hypothetical protein ABI675_07670 [Chitinophagaceae bacterium]